MINGKLYLKGDRLSVDERWLNICCDVERSEKRLKRAGKNFLSNIFKQDGNCLSGEKALLIYNVLGMSLSDIIILADSHNLKVDKNEFEKLWREEVNILKKSIQCKK